MDDAGLRELLGKATPRPVRAVWEPADFDLAIAAVDELPRLLVVSEKASAFIALRERLRMGGMPHGICPVKQLLDEMGAAGDALAAALDSHKEKRT